MSYRIIVDYLISCWQDKYLFIISDSLPFGYQNLYVCEWLRLLVFSFVAQCKVSVSLGKRIWHFQAYPLMIIGAGEVDFSDGRPVFLTIIDL